MIKHSIDTLPLEACGLVVSKIGDDTSICSAIPMQNLSKKDRRVTYQIGPKELIETEMKLKKRGLEPIGVYHSHPSHSSIPSKTDLQSAYTNWLYFIVGIDELNRVDIRAWILHDSQFSEREFQFCNKEINFLQA